MGSTINFTGDREMFTLEDRLSDVKTGDLLRAFNSNKEYIKFEFSVFNAGAVTRVICTDRYSEPEDNGYDFILCNDLEVHETLKEILKNRLKLIAKSWTQWCYHKDWEIFLKGYGLSEHKYKQLLKLENN